MSDCENALKRLTKHYTKKICEYTTLCDLLKRRDIGAAEVGRATNKIYKAEGFLEAMAMARAIIRQEMK